MVPVVSTTGIRRPARRRGSAPEVAHLGCPVRLAACRVHLAACRVRLAACRVRLAACPARLVACRVCRLHRLESLPGRQRVLSAPSTSQTQVPTPTAALRLPLCAIAPQICRHRPAPQLAVRTTQPFSHRRLPGAACRRRRVEACRRRQVEACRHLHREVRVVACRRRLEEE